MDSDLILVIGVVIALLGFPALINSFATGRSVRMAIALMVIGAMLIVMAVASQPGGYNVADVPGAFVRVVAKIFN